jgi:Cytochrome C oxidase subunit II, transmembrane domain
MSFQEEGTPIAAGIIDLHNKIMYYLIIILTIILYITTMRIINNRYINRIKYFNENSTKWIEFI